MLEVFNQRRVAWIGQHSRDGLGRSQPALHLAQQRQAAVTGHVTAGKAGGGASLLYGWEWEQFRVTNCARRSGRLRFHSTPTDIDRKSTRLNSSHLGISYAVFCL